MILGTTESGSEGGNARAARHCPLACPGSTKPAPEAQAVRGESRRRSGWTEASLPKEPKNGLQDRFVPSFARFVPSFARFVTFPLIRRNFCRSTMDILRALNSQAAASSKPKRQPPPRPQCGHRQTLHPSTVTHCQPFPAAIAATAPAGTGRGVIGRVSRGFDSLGADFQPEAPSAVSLTRKTEKISRSTGPGSVAPLSPSPVRGVGTL